MILSHLRRFVFCVNIISQGFRAVTISCQLSAISYQRSVSEFRVQSSEFRVSVLVYRRLVNYASVSYFLGVPLRVGLSAISLLASFLPAQKNLQIPQSPFPNPISHHLAKDAAPIPNATGYELWAASFGQNCSQLIAHSSWPIFNFKFSIP